jgi:hypothetical protein
MAERRDLKVYDGYKIFLQHSKGIKAEKQIS